MEGAERGRERGGIIYHRDTESTELGGELKFLGTPFSVLVRNASRFTSSIHPH